MDIAELWSTALAAPWSRLLVALVIAVVAAVIAAAVVGAIVRAVARRRQWPDKAVHRLRWPFRWLLLVVAVWTAVHLALGPPARGAEDVRAGLDRVFAIGVIAFSAWFACVVVSLLVDLVLKRYPTDVADNRRARRVRTEVLVIRRVVYVAIVVVAVAAALLTFPAARAAGASLLASAGVVSIIGGIAAQSTLGNLVAGMQLALSGAIRVDDVVVADGLWGRIEEITLTYVVVHVWDDRRLVLPSTYFTTTPFENWTRNSSELMQGVLFELDWFTDVQAMRDELHAVLARTKLWDGRIAVLQVTDAVGGRIQVRILVSAVDSGTLFDLRCFVREELIRWLREQQPDALPRTRVLMAEPSDPQKERAVRSGSRSDRELFGGSAAGDARGKDFTGPIPVPRPE